MKTPKDFKVGEIYKMKVALRSHVKSPYYVYIKSVGQDYIETSIPYYHSLKISFLNKDMWNYHIPRMLKTSHVDTIYKRLIYNQKNLVNENTTHRFMR